MYICIQSLLVHPMHTVTRIQVLGYKIVTLEYVGHEMRAILSFRYLHNIVPSFCKTPHTLNSNILFIRDKTIHVRNDSLKRCEFGL